MYLRSRNSSDPGHHGAEAGRRAADRRRKDLSRVQVDDGERSRGSEFT